ncbi:MAG: NRDE family protein [Anaeromyxobacteraceae bacterium]
MCTLAVAFQADRRWPLVVAANRDERLHRTAEGWGLRDGANGIRFAAPRDLLAGGTWIGLSSRGIFAGLTNYHAPVDWYPDSSRRSRGEIVGLALAHPTVAESRRAISALDPAGFNPFHLVVADASEAFLWWCDGERAAIEPLGPGLHVVTESAAHGDEPRGELVRSRWPVEPSIPHLREVMSLHASDPGARTSTCIHMDPVYGTRSATFLRLAAELGASELLVADGPPCRSPLEDRADLVAALARST